MTFAQFETMFGDVHYTSPCIASCGNASDPFVDAVSFGSHANGFVDVAANGAFTSEEVLEAAGTWRERLEAAAGEEYVVYGTFNCERTHNELARAAFATAQVPRIRFGRDLGTRDCG